MLKHKPIATKETKDKANRQTKQDTSEVHRLSISQAQWQPSNHLIQNHKAVTKQIKEISAQPLIYKTFQVQIHAINITLMRDKEYSLTKNIIM